MSELTQLKIPVLNEAVVAHTVACSYGDQVPGGGGRGFLVGVRSTIRSDPWGGGRFGEGPIHDPDQKVPSGSKSATVRIKKCTLKFMNSTTNPWYF